MSSVTMMPGQEEYTDSEISVINKYVTMAAMTDVSEEDEEHWLMESEWRPGDDS